MSQIKFTLENPDSTPPNQAVLYLGKSNTLRWVFTSDKANIKLAPEDVFTIKIPSTLITGASKANITDTPDWIINKVTPPGAGNIYYIFELICQKNLDFSTPVVITFSNLSPRVATQDQVSANYLLGGRSIAGNSATLAAQNPPDQPQSLIDYINFSADVNHNAPATVPVEFVYLSPPAASNTFLPITNEIVVKLELNRHLNLVEKGWDAANPPKFTFSFSYGNENFSLTDHLRQGDDGYNALTSAWNIHCELDDPGDRSLWSQPSCNHAADAPAWEVRPVVGNQHLLTVDRPALCLKFSHIITVVPGATAMLYIQWQNVPGYNDGSKALDLDKKFPEPQVVAFTGSGQKDILNLPNQSAPFRLEWETFAAVAVRLFYPDGSGQDLDFTPALSPGLTHKGFTSDLLFPEAKQFDLQLAACDDKGNRSVRSTPVSVNIAEILAPKITKFERKVYPMADGCNWAILLTWEVENALLDTVALIDGDPREYPVWEGCSIEYILTPEKPLMKSYTLHVKHKSGGLSDSSTIATNFPDANFMPEILSLDGKIIRDENGNAQLEFSYVTTNLGPDGRLVSMLYGLEVWPHPGGAGKKTIPLSADDPLRCFYLIKPVLSDIFSKECIGYSKGLHIDYAPAPGRVFDLDATPRGLAMSPTGKTCLVLLTGMEHSLARVAHFNAALLPSTPRLHSHLIGHSVQPGAGNSCSLAVGPDNRAVIAATDGSMLWFAHFDVDALDRGGSVVFCEPYYAFWTGRVSVPAVLAGGKVWVTGDNGLACVDLNTKALTMVKTTGFTGKMADVVAMPYIKDNFVCVTDFDGNVGRFDGSNAPAEVVAGLATHRTTPENAAATSVFFKKMASNCFDEVLLAGAVDQASGVSGLDMSLTSPRVEDLKTGPIEAVNITTGAFNKMVMLIDRNGRLYIRPGSLADNTITKRPPGFDLAAVDAVASADNTRIFVITTNSKLQVLEPVFESFDTEM